jgi:hypothetical protein
MRNVERNSASKESRLEIVSTRRFLPVWGWLGATARRHRQHI